MRSIIVIVGSVFFVSCGTQRRATYNYLEEIRDTSFKKTVYIAEPIIQKKDLLSIQIYSAATDPKADQLYNLTTQNNTGGQNAQLLGYLVDQNGNIELPRIGVIHAEGLKKE